MSTIRHDPEFSSPAKAPANADAKELAAAYARVFIGDEDGKRVLADLRAKFGSHRPRFSRSDAGRFDTIGAALIDGEAHVILEIENAIRIGAPSVPPI